MEEEKKRPGVCCRRQFILPRIYGAGLALLSIVAAGGKGQTPPLEERESLPGAIF